MSISEGPLPTCMQYSMLDMSQRTPLCQAPRGSRALSYIKNSKMVEGFFLTGFLSAYRRQSSERSGSNFADNYYSRARD